MAYRSWLKDVRRINDLGQHLGHFPNNKEGWDREWESEKKLLKLLETRTLPVDAASEIYYNGGLHDGFVYGITREKDRIEMTISNTWADYFSQEFYTETDQELVDLMSPVRLVFEGVNYANGVRKDPEGWLRHDDWLHWSEQPKDHWRDNFVRCWFYEQGGKLQWIGEFRKQVQKRKLSDELFILIDCEKTYAMPESERTLRKSLGNDCYDAMKYIESLPKGGPWVPALRRYLDEKGIARRGSP